MPIIMHIKSLFTSLLSVFIVASIALIGIPGIALATDTPTNFNSHYYSWVDSPGVSFADAASQARGMSFEGLPGHLVNLTSSAEADFVTQLVPQSVKYWIGSTVEATPTNVIAAKWLDGPERLQQYFSWDSATGAGSNVGNSYSNFDSSFTPSGSFAGGVLAGVGSGVVSSSVWNPQQTQSCHWWNSAGNPYGRYGCEWLGGYDTTSTYQGGNWRGCDESTYAPCEAAGFVVEFEALAPTKPTDVMVTSGSRSATVSWAPPASDGGSAITSYVAEASPGGKTCSVLSSARSCIVDGLTNGVSYVLTLYALNSVGQSEGVLATAAPLSVPDAPTVNTPTSPSAGRLTWTWTPNGNGGLPVTSYSWSGACTGSGFVTTVTCSNLNVDDDYSLAVVSINALGSSSPGIGLYSPFDRVVKLATQNTWDQASSVCALLTSGKVICFGDTRQVGQPASELRFMDIAGAAESYCGVTITHSIVCWGQNRWGQLSVPTLSNAVSIYGTNVNYCALTASGTPVCWGLGDWGQTSAPSLSGFDQIVVGRSLGCARSSTTLKLTCWGTNRYTPSSDSGAQVVSMAMSDYVMCEIGLDGALNCAIATLDDGIGQPASGAHIFAAADVRLVATVGNRICYVTMRNTLSCNDSIPQQSFSIQEATQLAIGPTYGCLLLRGRIGCWGGISVPDTLPGVAAPSAPTVATPSTSASGQLTWTWAPNSSGGSAITSYSWSGACSGSGNVTTVTCSGLTGGTNYTLNVTATNAIGTSSAGSSSLLAIAIPDTPTVNIPTRPASGQLAWTWSPNGNGGSVINSYSWSGACSGSGNVTTVTCSGLTGGTNYTLNVTATNAVGSSPAGSSSLVAPTEPLAPTVSSPTRPASGQLAWTWSPNATGGSPITSYSWSGACSGSGNVTTVTCSGLTGGTNYTLNVTATNAVGTSSAGSSSLLATSIPAAPTVNLPNSPASGQLIWAWSPNSSGGSAITSYSWTGACSGSGLVTTVTCSELTGGTSYTLNVTATNGVGTSGSGSRSGTALTYPGAPTANASPANGALSVTWAAPSSNGGTAITGYTATAIAAGSSYSCTSTTLSCTITGLTNGTTYSVSVVATNSKGNSTPSNTVSIYPAPDTKFLAYSPNSVVLVKSNFQVLVANAKAGALVTVTAAGATKTCTANAVGECSVTLNSTKSSGWVIVASYVDGKKTVSTSGSYRVNIANVTVSSVQIAKGKSFTIKIASGAPGTKFQVVASSGTTYSVTLTSSGAGTITVATKAKGPLTLLISDNGILLQTTTVAVV